MVWCELRGWVLWIVRGGILVVMGWGVLGWARVGFSLGRSEVVSGFMGDISGSGSYVVDG